MKMDSTWVGTGWELGGENSPSGNWVGNGWEVGGVWGELGGN